MSDSRLHKQLQFYSSTVLILDSYSAFQRKVQSVTEFTIVIILQYFKLKFLCKPCNYNKYRKVQQVVVSSYNDTHTGITAKERSLALTAEERSGNIAAECE
jgi:hypothetical protein